jgi:hypothetical protein
MPALGNFILLSSIKVQGMPMRGLNLATADFEHETHSTPLIDFLRHDYAQLRIYLGDVEFGRLARARIAAHFSHQPNARWYSNGLPAFMAQSAPWSSRPELAELARLEYAFHKAFDAADVMAFTLAELDATCAENFSALAFKQHPSVSVLEFTSNACSIWSALKCDEAPPRAQRLSESQTVVVWRQGGDSRFRILGSEEATALAALHEGLSFARLCEVIDNMAPEESALRAARYLRGWTEAEIMLPPEDRP